MTKHKIQELHELTLTVLLALACPLVLPIWLIARYPRSSGERESSVYKWAITQAQPGRIAPNGNIECAPTRKPKPVPSPQPNRRKKKKSKNKR